MLGIYHLDEFVGAVSLHDQKIYAIRNRKEHLPFTGRRSLINRHKILPRIAVMDYSLLSTTGTAELPPGAWV